MQTSNQSDTRKGDGVMKRGWKIFWIIISAIAVIGISCCVIAGALGFSFYDLNISSGSTVVDLDDEDESLWMEGEDLLYFDEITNLELEIDACKLIIVIDNEDTVRVDASQINRSGDKEALKVKEKDGCLSVETADNWQEAGGTLKIYLPAGTVFNRVEVDADASDVEINGIASKIFLVNVDASSFVVRNMDVKQLEAELDAGSLQMDGMTNGTVKLDCEAGDLQLTLEEDEKAFDYYIECDMGDVRINGEEYGGFSTEHHVNHHADKVMQIDCETGSVNVEFQK